MSDETFQSSEWALKRAAEFKEKSVEDLAVHLHALDVWVKVVTRAAIRAGVKEGLRLAEPDLHEQKFAFYMGTGEVERIVGEAIEGVFATVKQGVKRAEEQRAREAAK